MKTTAERRVELSRAMLSALEKTWQLNDESGLLDDPVHRISVLRGGCEHYLAGEFDAMGDGVSLGLAFLTLAREALILNGFEMAVVSAVPTEEAT